MHSSFRHFHFCTHPFFFISPFNTSEPCISEIPLYCFIPPCTASHSVCGGERHARPLIGACQLLLRRLSPRPRTVFQMGTVVFRASCHPHDVSRMRCAVHPPAALAWRQAPIVWHFTCLYIAPSHHTILPDIPRVAILEICYVQGKVLYETPFLHFLPSGILP